MKKIRTYTAEVIQKESEGGWKFYICQAYSKKQMKAAGMNMKLDWQEAESFEKAEMEARCRGLEITRTSNVTNFAY